MLRSLLILLLLGFLAPAHAADKHGNANPADAAIALRVHSPSLKRAVENLHHGWASIDKATARYIDLGLARGGVFAALKLPQPDGVNWNAPIALLMDTSQGLYLLFTPSDRTAALRKHKDYYTVAVGPLVLLGRTRIPGAVVAWAQQHGLGTGTHDLSAEVWLAPLWQKFGQPNDLMKRALDAMKQPSAPDHALMAGVVQFYGKVLAQTDRLTFHMGSQPSLTMQGYLHPKPGSTLATFAQAQQPIDAKRVASGLTMATNYHDPSAIFSVGGGAIRMKAVAKPLMRLVASIYGDSPAMTALSALFLEENTMAMSMGKGVIQAQVEFDNPAIIAPWLAKWQKLPWSKSRDGFAYLKSTTTRKGPQGATIITHRLGLGKALTALRQPGTPDVFGFFGGDWEIHLAQHGNRLVWRMLTGIDGKAKQAKTRAAQFDALLTGTPMPATSPIGKHFQQALHASQARGESMTVVLDYAPLMATLGLKFAGPVLVEMGYDFSQGRIGGRFELSWDAVLNAVSGFRTMAASPSQ